MNEKILVTGGSVFVGGNLFRKLLEIDYQIIPLKKAIRDAIEYYQSENLL